MKNSKHIFFVGAIIAGFLIVVIGLFYVNNIKEELESEALSYLSEISKQNSTLIEVEIEGTIEEIEAVAIMIEGVGNYNVEDILKELVPLGKKENFKRMGIALPNGDAYTTDGEIANIKNRDYFEEGLKGNSVISEPLNDQIDNSKEQINVYSTPVYQGENVAFVLFATVDSQNLSMLLGTETFNNEGYSIVINNKGDIIVDSQHKNRIMEYNSFFDLLEKSKLESSENFKQVEGEITGVNEGNIVYTYQGTKRYANFERLNLNDWIVVSVVPESSINQRAQGIVELTVLMVATYIFIICVLFMLILKGRIKTEKQLMEIAFTDDVTKGKNWPKFKMEAKTLIEKAPYTLVLFDIDRFRFVNSAYGNMVGDQVLRATSQILEELTGKDEVSARVSGDNFVVLSKGSHIEKIYLNKIIMFTKRLNEEKNKLHISEKLECHFGIYHINDPKEDFDKMKEKANLARIEAKNKEGQEYFVYSERLKKSIAYEKRIESQMEDALKNGELKMYLQPKFDLHSDSFCGAEALVRWEGKDKKMIYPDAFIPIFERTGFITKLDFFMFEEACKTLKRWEKMGNIPLKISVNISRKNLNVPEFIPNLLECSKKYGIDKNQLELELTESCVFDNVELMIETGKILREHGFQISMDDFGSGYSSVSLLEALPLDTIKLDKGFFSEDMSNKKRFILVKSIIDMVKKLDMVALAEGIETEEEVMILKKIGCDVIQGYYFGRPMPLDEFEKHVFKIKKDLCEPSANEKQE